MRVPSSIARRRNRDQLLLQSLDLVRPIAAGYARTSSACLEDLIQVGVLGLFKAAEGFQPSNGVPFWAYARPHVRGAILHYLRDQCHLVRLPRRLEEWRQKQTKAPAPLAVAHEDGQPERHPYRDLLWRWNALSHPLPLDEVAASEAPEWTFANGEAQPASQIPVALAYQPVALDDTWNSATVQQLLALVSPRQRRVLRSVILKGWSYRRTAAAMGVSAPTVQRLLQAALADLRSNLSTCQVRTLAPSSCRAASAAPGC